MIAVGIGCRRDSPAARIGAVVEEALAQTGLALGTVDALAVPAFKADEPGIVRAAEELGLPVKLVHRAELDAVQPLCATRSRAAEERTGLAAVSEAAALAAAGRNARLLLPRIARDGVTCAVARGDGA
ncbi:MAG: cobalamin biosynthesis protein [Rhodospirillaceae bacterium]|nr:cobalamin biosynthesis protein [Rhodospirillaceae bacterium]MYJ71871.1 cobalamin biosynthesis protein [Rhodospirillaceae bacterium]